MRYQAIALTLIIAVVFSLPRARAEQHQKERYLEQDNKGKKGEEEISPTDLAYVEAMEYGMPPAAGFGVSQRLFALLADKSIRETVIFPPMKSEK